MKSLWIVNKCCGALHEHLYGKKTTGGLWLDAALSETVQYPQDQIAVVNVEAIEKIRTVRIDHTTYYTLPGKPNFHYDYQSAATASHWKTVLEAEKPDVLLIWGTEFPYGLAAMNAAPQIPAVIYVQGILDSIAKYYTAGLSDGELRYARTLRDVLTRSTIRQIQRQFAQRAEYEREMIAKAGHVILENQWSMAYIQKISPSVTTHVQYIPISDVFRSHKWDAAQFQPHTIMCPAADYSVKGLHMLLKALRIVRQQYPDVKLEVPGAKLNFARTLRDKLRCKGFDKLIVRMLEEYGLQENVVYLGRLTAQEMAQHMARANCFVVSSSIENHSSTLKEAMTVGVPAIASYVGGIPEYAESGRNALLYRFEDYEVLARWIMRTFADLELCRSLSEEALKSMTVPAAEQTGYCGLRGILEQLMGGELQA